MKIIDAAKLQVGQWFWRNNGAYLVDGITVNRGRAYIGTNRGICVVAADEQVAVSDE